MIWLACTGAFAAGLAIGGAWSLRRIKRPPRHVHDWGKWSRIDVKTHYVDTGTFSNITKQHRTCKSCGLEQVDKL